MTLNMANEWFYLMAKSLGNQVTNSISKIQKSTSKQNIENYIWKVVHIKKGNVKSVYNLKKKKQVWWRYVCLCKSISI